MDGKMAVGIVLIVGIMSIVFLAAPIQAYLNGTANGDMLQTQDRLGIKNRDCTQAQNRSSQRTGECVTNRTCTQTMNMEQFRNQHRERTQSQDD